MMDETTIAQLVKLLTSLVMNTDRIASALERREPQDDDTDEPPVADLSGRPIR